MSPDHAIRFLAHEAQYCRERDEHEALCLLLPALLRALDLPPMDPFEAWEFRQDLKRSLGVESEVIKHV